MTAYNLMSAQTVTQGVKERKAERRKIIEAVWARRKEINKRYHKKMPLQAAGEML
jgi:hypothetical protein